MPQKINNMSLYSPLVQSILALCVMIVIALSTSIIYIVDKQGNQHIVSDTRAWANILAKSSSAFLESDNDNSQSELKK
jgi:hypothetical protein